MKKILASLLIITVLCGNLAVFATPKKAEAFWGFGDISFDPPTTVQAGGTYVNVAKQVVGEILKKVLKRLANKVLNKMLKKTVNWALTGFGPWEAGGNAGGQPFYVQNSDSLMKNIKDQELIKTIQGIQDSCKNNDGNGGCPYGKDLARSLVKEAISGGQYHQQQFDLDKYSSTWQEFANVSNPQGFSQGGGWQTWEGMNSNPNNTPFGAYLTTAFKVSEKQQAGVGKQQQELANNNGFLSLRKCVAYEYGKEPTSEIDFSLFGKKGNTQTIDDLGNGNTDPVFTTQGEEPTTITSDLPPGQSGGISTTGLSGAGSTTGAYTGGTGTSSEDYGISNGTGNAYNDFFGSTYALPGMTVDNCTRYEVTTPGAIAKEQLGKVLTSTIDKQIADSTTGNTLLDSLVDMAAVFVEQGLDKLITKATTKKGDQQIYAGGIEGGDVTYLGAGNGANTDSAWYSENGKDPIVIQDPYDPKKLHPDLIEGIKYTELELEQIDIILEMLRAQPQMYKQLDECLPGPDFGWEQRLKDEFSRSTKRLDKKSQKDNKKGDKAQEAIARLERLRDQEISKTKLAMLKVIPNSIPILGKMTTITNLASDIRQAEQKLVSKTSALAILTAIEESLASESMTNFELVELKKQYAGIMNSVSKEETLEDTLEDKQRIAADIFTSFDWSNPKSLISKCVEGRKTVSDQMIGEDLGETLYCIWQTHDNHTSKDVPNLLFAGTGLIGAVGTTGGGTFNVTTKTFGAGSSPYDAGRSVQIWVGNEYTQDESPFDSGGKDSEFNVDCNKYYRASLSVYEDSK